MDDNKDRETETSTKVIENLIRANQALTICHILMKASKNDNISDRTSKSINENKETLIQTSTSTQKQNTNFTNMKSESSIPHMKPIKDAAYWERRRRNNLAAKRSRDAKKTKETENAIRVTIRQQENEELKVQIKEVKNEIEKLKGLILSQEDKTAME